MTRRQIENSPLLYLSASLVTLTAFSGFILTSIPASADNDTAIDEVDITVPSSCTISGGTTFNLSMDPNTYEEAGPSNITAYCNDSEGFAVYAKGTSTVDETNGDNAKLLGLTATNKIATGTATSGSTSNWAMKLVLPTGSPTYPATIVNGYNAYSVVPTSWTKVINRDSGTDVGTNAEGSSFSAYYGIFISGIQAPDTYTGQVTYALVHPATADAPTEPQTTASGKICYYPNGQNVIGTMGCQTIPASGTFIGVTPTSAILLASNFSREGYGFAGWSDVNDYATNPNAHFYGPQEDIEFTAGQYTSPNNGLSLYAVWIKSEGSLQDSNRVSSVCDRLTAAIYNDEGDSDESTWSITAGLNSISALTDIRDDQTYAIAKLTDGKCWMIENLRLDNTTVLSSTYTNNPLLPLNNTWWHSSDNYSDTIPTSNHLSASHTPSYSAPWCVVNSADCDNQSMLNTDNVANRGSNNATTNTNTYSYGNYYNWYSATAGNGTYSKSSGKTSGDICPLGWHLPSGTGSGEFGSLSNSLGGNKNSNNVAQNMTNATSPTAKIMLQRPRHFPINLIYSGSIYGAAISNRGSSGDYWSSSAYNENLGLSFFFSSNDVTPGTSANGKYNGKTVRCLAGPSS